MITLAMDSAMPMELVAIREGYELYEPAGRRRRSGGIGDFARGRGPRHLTDLGKPAKMRASRRWVVGDQSQWGSIEMLSIVVATAGGLYTLGEGRAVALEGREVGALASRGPELWAIVGGHSLWARRGGQQWKGVATLEQRRLNCLLAYGDVVVLGASEGGLFVLRNGTIKAMASFDAAPGREDWFTPWGGPPDVRSMDRDDGTLFVNVHVGGVLRSSDLENWAPTIEIRSDVHQVLVHEGRVLAATASGLATSDDRGATWRFAGKGLHGSYARAVAVCDGAVLMSASEGPPGRRAALYRREHGAEEFVKCSEGLPAWFGHNIDTGCLAAQGPVAAFTTDDGAVFASEDAGRTWSLLADDLPAGRWIMIA